MLTVQAQTFSHHFRPFRSAFNSANRRNQPSSSRQIVLENSPPNGFDGIQTCIHSDVSGRHRR